MVDITKNIKNVVANVSKTSIPMPIPTDAANQAFNNLVSAWKECSIVAEQEQTKRENIRAYRDINVKAIEENSAILKLYLEKTFAERAYSIQEMFDRLDKGIELGNTDLIASTIGAIVDIIKQSPLEAAKQLIANYHDPNVTMIEI
ncbi:MAG: hypothetical protein NTW85_09375 [Methylococcales bacterium]|nr:hypothetical protein [Methylococcales bacterium]